MKDERWTESYFTETATIWAIFNLIMDIVSSRLLRSSRLKVIKISIGPTDRSTELILVAEKQANGWMLKTKN